MMKTKQIFFLFLLVATIQLLVPAQMILSNEKTLSDGNVYKFKTRPIDPNDPFRGKFITLSFEINTLKTHDTLWQRKDKAYLYLKRDNDGYAVPTQLSREKLEHGNDYVVANVTWYDKREREVHFNLPFNRFYMEESKAYEAEVAHQEAQRDPMAFTTYAVVHIKDGTAVLADVMINDRSITEHVLERRVQKGEKP